MKSYLLALVVLAIKLTHQGMDSRHMQKVNCSDKIVFGEHSTQYKHCYR